jgi:hypothetical protein
MTNLFDKLFDGIGEYPKPGKSRGNPTLEIREPCG